MTSPLASHVVYLGTDVGGAYAWDAARARWLPIVDSLSPLSLNYMGVESLAVDPSDAAGQHLFAALGEYLNQRPSDVFESFDGGGSWTSTGLVALKVPMGGNEDERWAGERLQVDPANTDVLYFGSRESGLFRGIRQEGAWTWSAIATATLPTGGATYGSGAQRVNVGQTFVALDPVGGTVSIDAGGPVLVSRVLYVGVFDTGSDAGGVYVSNDGAESFAKLAGGLPSPMRGVVAADGHGTLYVTFDPYSATGGALASGGAASMERDGGGLTMLDIENVDAGGLGFCGLALDAEAPETVLLSESRANENLRIFRSVNAGQTWARVTPPFTQGAATSPVRQQGGGWFGHTSCLAIDGASPNDVWAGDWYGPLHTLDITSTPSPTWDFPSVGEEEACPNTMRSPPAGDAILVSGVADLDGFRWTATDQIPPTRLRADGGRLPGWTSGVDYCASQPSMLARVYGSFVGVGGGATSVDDGVTWDAFPGYPGLPDGGHAFGGRIAVSALDPNTFVWLPDGMGLHVTHNGGATWTASTGGFSGDGPLTEWDYQVDDIVADRVSGAFYALEARAADGGSPAVLEVYRSDDDGDSFQAQTSVPLGGSTGYKVDAVPGQAGQVWLALNAGLYRSTNAASSFSQVKGFRMTLGSLVAFGAAAPNHNNPTVFVGGTLADAGQAIFRSDEATLDVDGGLAGVTWVPVEQGGPALPPDQLDVIEGDGQVYGRVFIGTGGRGWFFGR